MTLRVDPEQTRIHHGQECTVAHSLQHETTFRPLSIPRFRQTHARLHRNQDHYRVKKVMDGYTGHRSRRIQHLTNLRTDLLMERHHRQDIMKAEASPMTRTLACRLDPTGRDNVGRTHPQYRLKRRRKRSAMGKESTE